MSAAPLLSIVAAARPRDGYAAYRGCLGRFCAALGCLISQHAVAPAHSLLPKSEAPTKVCSPPSVGDVLPRARVPLGLPAGALDA